MTAGGRAAALAVLTLVGPAVGWGQEAPSASPASGSTPQPPGALLAISAGQFNIADQEHVAVEGGVQWRGGGHLWVLHPIAGAAVTDAGSVNAYFGFAFDLPVDGRGFFLGLSFAPGYYHRGAGKDLGDSLEFRSGFEIGWRSEDGTRVGVEIHHLSNASLGERNPGENSLVLVVSFPPRRLFGR